MGITGSVEGGKRCCDFLKTLTQPRPITRSDYFNVTHHPELSMVDCRYRSESTLRIKLTKALSLDLSDLNYIKLSFCGHTIVSLYCHNQHSLLTLFCLRTIMLKDYILLEARINFFNIKLAKDLAKDKEVIMRSEILLLRSKILLHREKRLMTLLEHKIEKKRF